VKSTFSCLHTIRISAFCRFGLRQKILMPPTLTTHVFLSPRYRTWPVLLTSHVNVFTHPAEYSEGFSDQAKCVLSTEGTPITGGQFLKRIFAPTGKVCAYGKSLHPQEKIAPSHSWHLATNVMLAPRCEVGTWARSWRLALV
jgi:hypothetical protein